MKTPITLLLGLALCPMLYAQDGQPKREYTNFQDTVFQLSEVSITVHRQRPMSITKLGVPNAYVPISGSVIPTTMLVERGIVNLQDAVKFMPGTRMRTTYGAYQQFQVRGFDHTPIMIDGVRDERTSINNSAPMGDLVSVERIELLKGPASVLYGHSTVGGILNIIRKSPTARKTLNTRLSYGSWNDRRAMIDMGGRLIGPFNYRAVLNWQDVEGYRYANDRRFSGYAAIGARWENQELDIRGGFNRDRYGTEIGLPQLMANDIFNADGTPYLAKGESQPGLNPRWRYNNESDFMLHHGTNVMAKYNYRFSPAFKLENRLAYTYDNIDYFSTEELSYPTSDNPIYKHYYMSKGKKKFIDLDTVQLTYPLRFAYTVHTINEQIETSGHITFGNGMKYNYLAGYNYVYFFRNTYRGYGGGYKLSELIEGPGLYSKVAVHNPHSMGYMDPYFSAGTATRNYTHGVYLQNLFELSDKFKVMLSGRFDQFIFKTATAKINRLKTREYSDLPDFDKTSTSALTYRIGAVYLPTPSLSVYGSFANFFQPYRNIVNTATTVYIGADGKRFYPTSGEEAFKAQKGYQGEIGARYNLTSRLQATASFFYIRRENENKTLNSRYVDPTDGKTKSVVGQVAGSDSKGLEVEVAYTPIANLSLLAGYGYTDARIRKFSFSPERLIDDGFMDKGIKMQDGMRLAGIPMNTFYFAASYKFTRGPLQGLGLNATATYMDNVYRDLNKTLIYPAYWDTDLGLSYRLKNGIRLQVNVNNVLDDDKYTQSLGTQIVPRTPRNYLFTIGYSL